MTEAQVAEGVYREFLIECLNGRRSRDAMRAAALIADRDQFDWERVWSIILEERIASLVYHTIRSYDLVPEWLVKRCRVVYLKTGIRNTLLMRELRVVLDELARVGIPVVVLKGAALLEDIYENLALRPMVDVDLLVPGDEATRALFVLAACGYKQETREIAPGAALAYENEVLLYKEQRPDLNLELHWSLFNSPYYQERLPMDQLWDSAIDIHIDGTPAKGLSSEWMLLHLCGHLKLHHYGMGLLWWNDIAEFMDARSHSLDWAKVMELATASSLVLPVQKVVPEIAGTWRTLVPSETLTQLAALVPCQDELRIYNAMITGGTPSGHRLYIDAREIHSWPGKVRFIYRNMVPTKEYMDERYQIKHPSMRPFYYLRRWVIGGIGFLKFRMNQKQKKGPDTE